MCYSRLSLNLACIHRKLPLSMTPVFYSDNPVILMPLLSFFLIQWAFLFLTSPFSHLPNHCRYQSRKDYLTHSPIFINSNQSTCHLLRGCSVLVLSFPVSLTQSLIPNSSSQILWLYYVSVDLSPCMNECVTPLLPAGFLPDPSFASPVFTLGSQSPVSLV